MNHKKIAEIAHVSTSTVSKALSGSAEISEELSEKIKKIAIECGYFKEKTKRKREYTNNKSLLIALIVPELLGYHYPEVVTHLKNEIEAKGAKVAIYVYDFDKNKANDIMRTIILGGATDGIITFCKPDFSTKPSIPIVLFGGDESTPYDSVLSNTSAIQEDCVKYLKDLGHKKIAYVGEPKTISAFKAFEKSLKKHSLEFSEDFVYNIDARLEAVGKEAAKRIVLSKRKPTAIIAAYDVIAISLVHELVKNGIKVPEEISVMGVNNISASAYAQVPLTTVETFSSEQYRTAVELLFNKILTETEAVQHITIEHKIIERQSTRKII